VNGRIHPADVQVEQKTDGDAEERLARLLSSIISRCCSAALLLRLRYINQVNIPQGKTPYLIVANHQTMFDGLWIMGGIPREQLPLFSGLAGSDLERNFGLTGRIMFRVGKPSRSTAKEALSAD